MVREVSERNAPPQNHHAHFIISPCNSFTVFSFLAGGARELVWWGRKRVHILPHHIAKRVSGGALTVPVRSFACQLDFPVMSSFVILDFETASNSEEFNLKDGSVPT